MEFNYETFGRIEAKPAKLKPINNANVKLKGVKDGRRKLPKADLKGLKDRKARPKAKAKAKQRSKAD